MGLFTKNKKEEVKTEIENVSLKKETEKLTEEQEMEQSINYVMSHNDVWYKAQVLRLLDKISEGKK